MYTLRAFVLPGVLAMTSSTLFSRSSRAGPLRRDRRDHRPSNDIPKRGASKPLACDLSTVHCQASLGTAQRDGGVIPVGFAFQARISSLLGSFCGPPVTLPWTTTRTPFCSTSRRRILRFRRRALWVLTMVHRSWTRPSSLLRRAPSQAIRNLAPVGFSESPRWGSSSDDAGP